MLRWLCIAVALLACPAAASAGSPFVSICWHDVADTDPDQTYMAVSTAKLVQQFNWLRENGYQPVGLDQILAARNGGPALPDKAVLLSFDDGYVSFYTHVFPLLKAFNFPAALALVGSWLEVPAGQPVPYGEGMAPRSLFVTWDQVREMQASGLVEIASHTWNLHHGILANPQGNREPAVITRLYDAATGAYEDDETYRARLARDFETNSAVIARETGRRPRMMVWPYGAYNGTAIEIARAAGMPVAATLDEGLADADDLSAIPRRLVANDPNLPAFVDDLRAAAMVPPMRAVRVDLDRVYDPDPARQEANLGRLIDRVKALGANAVFLQAFTDTGEAWFANRVLPVKADLFNRVSWQLASRLNILVYARLTMADPAVAEDLARYAPLDGLAFEGAVAPEAARAIVARVRPWRSPLFTTATDPRTGADYRTIAIGDDDALRAALAEAAGQPDGLRRTIFALPADRPARELNRQLTALVLAGAKNLAFGPDDFLDGKPEAAAIVPIFSLKESHEK